MEKRCDDVVEAFSLILFCLSQKAGSTNVNDLIAIMRSTEFKTSETVHKLKNAARCAKVVSSIISADKVLCRLSKVQLTLKDGSYAYMYMDQSVTF